MGWVLTMRSRIILRIAAVAAAFAFSVPLVVRAAEPPRGTFVRADAGGVSWRLELDGKKFVVSRAGGEIAEGSYVTANDRMEFRDEKGPFADKAAGPGTYRWTREGGKLVFQLLQDASAGRSQALSGSAWEKSDK